MKLLCIAACSVLVVGISSCTRPPQTNYFSGEWAAINTSLYLNIHGDSLSFVGHVTPTDWSDYRANPSPQGPNGWTGPFFQPPSSPFGFTLGNSQELVIHLYHNLLDTLGRVTEDRDTLVLQRDHPGDQIRLLRLHADTAIHLTKIQFSSGGCPAGCPTYDLELRNGSLIFAEPAGVDDGEDQRSVRYFGGAFSPESFKRCEEIVQKAGLSERKSRFEPVVQPGTDTQSYCLTVDINDTSYSVPGDSHQFPSELLPLIPYLASPKDRVVLTPKDTTVLFRSRIRLVRGVGSR